MPDPEPQHDGASQPATERTPLLADQAADSGERGLAESQSEDEGASVTLAEEPSTTKLVVICCSMWFGVFLNALDMTVIAALSGPISASFGSFSLFSWLASAYLISNAAFQPLSGKLTDIYGRRNGLVLSNIFFLAGNLICGLAQAEWVMILGRVVAGIGGGCINTIATVVASDLVPLRRRGVFQGIGNVFFGVGAGIGGFIGGWIGDTWSWRWAFLVQVPLILVSGTLVAFTVNIPLKETNKSKIKRVDFLGSFTLVASLVLLLLGLNAGGNTVPWNHPLVYVPIPLALVILVGFGYVEEKIAPEPIIPVRLLLDRTVLAACLCNWFASMAIYAYLFYAPVFFQVLGESASAAGLRLVSSSLGTAVGSVAAGVIMRASGKYYTAAVLSGLLFLASSLANIYVLQQDMPKWPPFVTFAVYGFSYGILLTITLIALISAVGHEFQAVITSASYAFRSTGSTIGIAVCSAIFQNVLQDRLWQELGQRKHAEKWIAALHDSIEALKDIPPDWKAPALRAYTDAFQGVWIAIAGLAALSILAGFCMREHTLHSNLARK